MLALGLCAVLFLFWLICGFALVALLHSKRNLLQNLLLAPVVGAAATVLLILTLNRAGLPIRRFGVPMGLAELTAGLVILWRVRPVVPWRRYLPFAATLLLALAIVGRPMLEFGFNWISYANDDMGNYVLGGHRFADHGFADVPDETALLSGQDLSQMYWFFHSILGARGGAELLIGWVLSVTGLSGHQIFMPIIVALHLVLISAAGAAVCRFPHLRLAALLTCILLSLSALSTMGVIYQLIGQVQGLGLLCGAVALLFRSFQAMSLRAGVRHGILTAIVLSGILAAYPEVLPFLGLSFAGYILIQIRRRALASRSAIIVLSMAGVGMLLIMQRYLFIALAFLLGQSRAGLTVFVKGQVLCPNYLVPVGMANLWGIVPMGAPLPAEPWLSVAIAAGGALLFLAMAAMLWQAWRGEPVAMVLLVMMGLASVFFVQRADFALFKLAMYVQPFLLSTVVLAWLRIVGCVK